MNDSPTPDGPPPELRFLKLLVTTLAGVMIVGLVVIVALLVIRLQPPDAPSLPDRVTLPEGAQATAFTRGTDWFAVVTADDEILIFDSGSGALRQRIAIE